MYNLYEQGGKMRRERRRFGGERREGFRGGFGGGFGRERKMFDVVCSDCGKDTQVPFKPTEGRPVYCRECYQKHRKF